MAKQFDPLDYGFHRDTGSSTKVCHAWLKFLEAIHRKPLQPSRLGRCIRSEGKARLAVNRVTRHHEKITEVYMVRARESNMDEAIAIIRLKDG